MKVLNKVAAHGMNAFKEDTGSRTGNSTWTRDQNLLESKVKCSAVRYAFRVRREYISWCDTILHGTLRHSLWCSTVRPHDAVRKHPMVRYDTPSPYGMVFALTALHVVTK